ILLSSLVSLTMAGQFIEDFYQLLSVKNAKQNIFSSAFSVELALGMLYMGAEGSTATEIKEVIGVDAQKPVAVQKYKDFMANFLREGKFNNMKLINRMYVSDKLGTAPDFNKQVEEPFLSTVEAIDMSNAVKASADISKAIDEQTSGQIKAIVNKNNLAKQPKALILNAFYFKVKWHQNFVPAKKMGSFRLENGKKVPVKMIRRLGKFSTGDFPELGAKVIELPFATSSLYMNIFLPKQLNGLAAVEESITGFNQPLDYVMAEVQIPEFKIAFSNDVTNILEKMNLQSMFSSTTADLSHLFANKAKGEVNGFIQKGLIEVTDNTANPVPSPSMRTIIPIIVFFCTLYFAAPPAKDERLFKFIVDQPFAFSIRDRNTIFFQGHVINPKQ
ncbi:hypothetical protein KR018_006780, partial [Drosophila ironensis]